MEGKDPDKGKDKKEENQIGKGKKIMEEEAEVQSQLKRGRKIMEELYLMSQSGKGKKKMEEEIQSQPQTQSPNPESFQCYFCDEMITSQEEYSMHMEKDHPIAIPWGRTRKRSSDGQMRITEYFPCLHCIETFARQEDCLKHLEKDHPDMSWDQTKCRSGPVVSDSESGERGDVGKSAFSEFQLNEKIWNKIIKKKRSESGDQEKSDVDKKAKKNDD